MKKINKKITLSLVTTTVLTTTAAIAVASVNSKSTDYEEEINYLKSKQSSISHSQIIQEAIQEKVGRTGVTTNKELNRNQKEALQNNIQNTVKNTGGIFDTYSTGVEKVSKVKFSFKMTAIHIKRFSKLLKKVRDQNILYDLLIAAMFENGEK